MSEKILKALMQLFAIIATPDSHSEDRKTVVESFLKRQLNQELVKEYLKVFNAYYVEYQDKQKKSDKPYIIISEKSTCCYLSGSKEVVETFKDELKTRFKFDYPLGFYKRITQAQTTDENILKIATDGGVGYVQVIMIVYPAPVIDSTVITNDTIGYIHRIIVGDPAAVAIGTIATDRRIRDI